MELELAAIHAAQAAAPNWDWHWAVGYALRPRTITQIGLRLDRLQALIDGSLAAQPGNLMVYVLDTEQPAVEKAAGCLAVYPTVNSSVRRTDTQTEKQLDLPATIDLFHVGGDPSVQGTYTDLGKASRCLTPGGAVLLDDIDHPDRPGVRAAVELFCHHRKVGWSYLPAAHGLCLVRP